VNFDAVPTGEPRKEGVSVADDDQSKKKKGKRKAIKRERDKIVISVRPIEELFFMKQKPIERPRPHFYRADPAAVAVAAVVVESTRG